MNKIIISSLAIVLIFSLTIAASDTKNTDKDNIGKPSDTKTQETQSTNNPQLSIPQMINYQGKLTDTLGNPQNDTFDMTFRIYDAAIGGTEYWNETQTDVIVTDGLFNVLLGSINSIDPSTEFPTGPDCYLEITVGTQTITPRQRIVSNAYTFFADEADNAANLDGVPASGYAVRPIQSEDIADEAVTMPKINQSGATTGQVIKWTDSTWTPQDDNTGGTPSGPAGGDLTGTYPNPTIAYGVINSKQIQDGQVQTVDIADLNVTTGKIADNAIYTGNIRDGQVLTADIADANVTMPKLNQSGATTGQVIKWTGSAWAPANDEGAGGPFLALAGGTMTGPITNTGNPAITMGKANFGSSNSNAGTNAFVAGENNSASGLWSTVSGGYSDTASGQYASIGGGYNNIASGWVAMVGGGKYNTTKAQYGGVLSGQFNLAGDASNDTAAVVAGGGNNSATGEYSFVGGGKVNIASARTATIGGGYHNTASAWSATVGGGYDGNASGAWSTVGGGLRDTASGDIATISGGLGNKATDWYATVAGGYFNTASGISAMVGGGYNNTASGQNATVSGGASNTASNVDATICGGGLNTANGWCATVGGGIDNSSSGMLATVGGGGYNSSASDYSFTVGCFSQVPSGYNYSAAFNGQTATASDQLRCATISKTGGSFTIDHPVDPNNKILNHYFVESPDMSNIYSGSAVLDASGRAEVQLPDYFDALNQNPRIQLTGVGSPEVYIAEDIQGNRFKIGGKPGCKVYWQVTGDRKDPSAQAIRYMMPVEQPKTGALAGSMLDDDFLVGCMKQLEEMGKAGEFSFRTAKGRQRYEDMKRLPLEIERMKKEPEPVRD